MWLAYSMPWTWGGGVGVDRGDNARMDLPLAAVVVYVKRSPAASSPGNRPRFSRRRLSVAHVVVAGVIYSACFADMQCWYLSLPYLETYMVLVVLGSAICADGDRR